MAMPELPEVETVVRSLRESVAGKLIRHTSCSARHILAQNQPDFPAVLVGQKITAIDRNGKNIFIRLDDGNLLWIHLRMTGQFIFQAGIDLDDPHNHVLFKFKHSDEHLVFRDVRKFGTFRFIPADDRDNFFNRHNFGRDALAVSESEFMDLIRPRKRMIKPLLLDQSLVAGLGNIYVDELLWESRVHPQKRSHRIAPRKLKQMHNTMLRLLNHAIANMGTTFDSFRGVNSEPGNFQSYLKAYQNAGNICPRCGRARIKKITVAQRGTHYCPHCQRL
jgi:formamidopyrimidine-DNA glycosylase